MLSGGDSLKWEWTWHVWGAERKLVGMRNCWVTAEWRSTNEWGAAEGVRLWSRGVLSSRSASIHRPPGRGPWAGYVPSLSPRLSHLYNVRKRKSCFADCLGLLWELRRECIWKSFANSKLLWTHKTLAKGKGVRWIETTWEPRVTMRCKITISSFPMYWQHPAYKI